MSSENNKKLNIKFPLFIIKMLLIIAFITGAFKLTFWFLWEYDNGPMAYDKSYQHALYLQNKQISNPDRDNEIIFFGSSTCAFGIDVDAVKEITGKDAQIFAIETAVAPDFLTWQLMRTAKAGDTVCYIFDKDTGAKADFITICCAFEEDKEFLKEYFNKDGYSYSLHKTTLIWRKLYALTAGPLVEKVRTKISSKDQVYSLSSFDENGNMNLNRDVCLIDKNVDSVMTLDIDELDPKLIKVLNEFNSYCKENDINFVIAFNMNPIGIYIEDDEEMNDYYNELQKLIDAPIITKVQDGLLPVDDFFNSHYHLNSNGAKEYSSRIARAMLTYL